MKTDIEKYYIDILTRMITENKTKGENRCVFLGKHEKTTHSIGKSIYEHGGSILLYKIANSLMKDVELNYKQSNYTNSDVFIDIRELDHAWNNIGEWQS